MSRLFDRSYKLTIDTVEIEGGGVGTGRIGLDIAFKVESTTKQEPNKIDLRVWNLNPNHRSALQKRSGSEVSKAKRVAVAVELEAGYADDRGVIFRGELRNLQIDHDGTDFVTHVEGSDAGRAYKVAHMSASYSPGALVYSVMRDCVNALGIGTGNLTDYASSISIPNLGKTFPEGYSASGPAERVMGKLCSAAGLSWSVQKGVLQLKPIGSPIQRQVYELGPNSGLVGTPVAEVDATVTPSKTGEAPKSDKKSGLIRVRSLLLHQLYPGAIIVLDTNEFKGGYELRQIDYVGDTAGGEWYCDMLVRPY